LGRKEKKNERFLGRTTPWVNVELSYNISLLRVRDIFSFTFQGFSTYITLVL